jgi:mRNA interferase MazF
VVLDQIRTVDKARLIKKLGRLLPETVQTVKAIIQEMLVD